MFLLDWLSFVFVWLVACFAWLIDLSFVWLVNIFLIGRLSMLRQVLFRLVYCCMVCCVACVFFRFCFVFVLRAGWLYVLRLVG